MFETTDELLKQIRLGEDSSLELKDLRYRGNQVNDPHRNSMADELAAMANTANGIFVLGVDDKSRTLVGIPEEKLDVVETWVRGICNDLIIPPLFCRIRKISVLTDDGVERSIVRVDVPRSLYVHKSPSGYFHRIGSSKREMSPDVLARLFQQRSQARIIRFDEQSVTIAPRYCLDKTLWKKFKTPLSPTEDEEFLLKLKLLTQDEDGNICPSVSGILMASQQPHEIITNAFIQAVSYRGKERNAAYQLDARDLVGPLDVQVIEAYQFVEKNMNVYATKEPARHEIPQYSMQAVFEALVNAVAHRDYSVYGSKIRLHLFSDRLELFSPGTIPNTMTIDTLPLRQAARNELLTSLLARCPIPLATYSGGRNFLMDRRGEGVPIIITESEKLSGRRPEYMLLNDAELHLTIFAAQAPCADDASRRYL
jgi:predicted HTH transcriptional regulator